MKKKGFGMMKLAQTDKNDFKSIDQKQVNKWWIHIWMQVSTILIRLIHP